MLTVFYLFILLLNSKKFGKIHIPKGFTCYLQHPPPLHTTHKKFYLLFAINSIERKSFVFAFSFKIQFKKEKEKENKREKLQKLRKKGIKSTLVLHFKSDIKKN